MTVTSKKHHEQFIEGSARVRHALEEHLKDTQIDKAGSIVIGLLTKQDREAVAEYLRALAAIMSQPGKDL